MQLFQYIEINPIFTLEKFILSCILLHYIVKNEASIYKFQIAKY